MSDPCLDPTPLGSPRRPKFSLLPAMPATASKAKFKQHRREEINSDVCTGLKLLRKAQQPNPALLPAPESVVTSC